MASGRDGFDSFAPAQFTGSSRRLDRPCHFAPARSIPSRPTILPDRTLIYTDSEPAFPDLDHDHDPDRSEVQKTVLPTKHTKYSEKGICPSPPSCFFVCFVGR